MAKTKPDPSPLGLGEASWAVLQDALDKAFAADEAEVNEIRARFEAAIPKEQQEKARVVLENDTTPTKSYRVGMVIQLAYGIAAEGHLDVTKRHTGARGAKGVAGRCGKYLKDKHVAASVDAYQNIAKNADTLTRGNFAEFDAFLKWASKPARTKDELRAALKYACLRIAQTARPVKSLPEIDGAKLSFAAVMELFEGMFQAPSGGAHEQFIVAALMHARVAQGGGKQRVETKRLNASDQSSSSAADVQLKTETRVDEAFEITANAWTEKLEGAAQTIRAHDLSRLHILAKVDDFPGMINLLKQRQDDISAIDLRAFVSVLVAELRRQYRATALQRLYELLDRYQPNIDLINQYVDRVMVLGLITKT